MPARIRFDITVVDRSPLAHNLYQLLFSSQSRFRLNFADEFASLTKRSRRFRPDILLINSNAIPEGGLDGFKFPCAAIVVTSRSRVDLKESLSGQTKAVLIEKPFYPYDLLSVANRLVAPKLARSRQQRKKLKKMVQAKKKKK